MAECVWGGMVAETIRSVLRIRGDYDEKTVDNENFNTTPHQIERVA